MARFKITITATGEMDFDASEFADGDEIPAGSEFHACIESAIGEELFDFLNNNVDDIQIAVEPIESPTSESL